MYEYDSMEMLQMQFNLQTRNSRNYTQGYFKTLATTN